MSKKFIKVQDTKVVYIHHMPFDEINGLGKTEEELSTQGILVDSIPEPEKIDGKESILHYDSESGFYYEYRDLPNSYGISEETYSRIIDDYTLELLETGIL